MRDSILGIVKIGTVSTELKSYSKLKLCGVDDP